MGLSQSVYFGAPPPRRKEPATRDLQQIWADVGESEHKTAATDDDYA